MKTIEFKSTKEKLTVGGREQELDITTVDLLKTAINNPVQGGYSVSDMLLRLKLLDLVTKESDLGEKSVQIEDADFAQLGRIVKETKWAVLSKTILEFVKLFD